MDVTEVLSKARDVLATKGWWQFGDGLPNPAYRVCVILALDEAAGGEENVWRPAGEFVAQVAGVTVDDLAAWNDDPSRTAEDVQLALKQAEELAAQS